MINETLYNKTVNILIDAYFNDTLEHGNCQACAVGNMVAANMNLGYEKKDTYRGIANMWKTGKASIFNGWPTVFYTSDYDQHIAPSRLGGDAKQQIDSTGYNWQDLAKIEYAFETANKCGDYMFNGLMAVIDVLDIIHDNTDTAATKSVKQRFVKSA